MGWRQDQWMANRLGVLAKEWEDELLRPNLSDEYAAVCAKEARMFRTAQSAVVGRLQREADREARRDAAE